MTTSEANAAGPRTIKFDTAARSDPGFITETGAAAGITVDTDGWYQLVARLAQVGTLNTTNFRFEIQTTGGTTLASQLQYTTSLTYSTNVASGVAWLAAGTKVVAWYSTGSVGALGSTDGKSHLRVVKLAGPLGPTGPTGPSGGPTGPTGPQGAASTIPGPAGVTTVQHLADNSVARPSGTVVIWYGSVEPVNMTAVDLWVVVT